MISVRICRTCSTVRSPSSPRAKVRICFTKPLPRLELSTSTFNNRRLRSSKLGSVSGKSWAAPTIGVSTLFKSWAMPLARLPRLSIRWARRNCCSRDFFSVMSVSTLRIDRGLPASSRTSVHRLSTITSVPVLVTLCNSPCHDPRSKTLLKAIATAVSGGVSG